MTMADLCTPKEFKLILDFAIGIADRGLPLAVVRLAPPGDEVVPEGPGLGIELDRKALEKYRIA